MKLDYSIIIPAYNEEKFLAKTLNHLNEAMKDIELAGEIIVTDNNSTDNTAELAKSLGATVVFEAVNQISRARNTGVKHANGQYLVFIDADTIAPAALIKTALDNMHSGKCVGGGATVSPDTKIPFLVQATLSYWNFLSRTLRLAAGCFVYARRDAFEASGGFSEKVYATEEIWFSMGLKRIGRKTKRKFCVINEPKVITSGRKLAWFSYTYQSLLLLLIFFFPFLTRFKALCSYWYKRPE